MKVLVVFSAILSIALCQLALKGYDYENSAGNFNRIIEKRNANGQFNFVHRDTEVQFADESHETLQNYIRMVSPQITAEQLPAVYIRHVPSPVKKEPDVPIIPVIPPQRAIKRQIQEIQGRAQPQQVFVVKDLPPSAQLGGRTLFVDRSPSHIQVNIEEIPFTFEGRPRQHKTIPQSVQQPALQHVQQPVQQHIVRQPAQHVHHIVRQPVQQFVQQPVQEVGQFVEHRTPIAQDIHLVNGFTPEVAKATQEHLSHVAAIKAVLPNIE